MVYTRKAVVKADLAIIEPRVFQNVVILIPVKNNDPLQNNDP